VIPKYSDRGERSHIGIGKEQGSTDPLGSKTERREIHLRSTPAWSASCCGNMVRGVREDVFLHRLLG